jgi:hypothetical protein
MSQQQRSTVEMRAKVRLTKQEIVHLWNGGILSLKVEAPDAEADLELRCPEMAGDRGTRILVRRISAEE